MWIWFKDIIFACIQFFQSMCGDWGLAIIIVTVILRLILTPLTARQYKSSYEMQKIQPKINELQQKYGDDKTRLNEEMSKIYADKKYNPIAGCLPVIIQMPIFIALYQVLREQIPTGARFFNIIPNLAASPMDMWSWSVEGFITCLPYIVLVGLFGVSMIFPMMMTPGSNRMTKIMSIYMVVIMLVFGFVAPAGVILFWDASSYIGLATQFIVRRVLKSKDEQEEAEVIEVKPVEVNVVRRERKARPKKKR